MIEGGLWVSWNDVRGLGTNSIVPIRTVLKVKKNSHNQTMEYGGIPTPDRDDP